MRENKPLDCQPFGISQTSRGTQMHHEQIERTLVQLFMRRGSQGACLLNSNRIIPSPAQSLLKFASGIWKNVFPKGYSDSIGEVNRSLQESQAQCQHTFAKDHCIELWKICSSDEGHGRYGVCGGQHRGQDLEILKTSENHKSMWRENGPGLKRSLVRDPAS